jgi:hypothetical protein
MTHEDYKFDKPYLFRINSKEQMKKWLTNLRYFVFTRSFGGHADGPDEFTIAIIFRNQSDLEFLMNLFNIPNNHFEDLQKKNDKRIEVFGYMCFIDIGKDNLFIRPCHKWSYTKDDDDFKACMLIEKAIIENNIESWVNVEYLNRKPLVISFEKYADYFE